MKHNHLKTAVLLGLAMSLSSYSAGMAAEITGPIVTGTTETYQEDVTITNGNSDHAAIQIGHKDNGTDTPDLEADISISTSGIHDITIDSMGYGIRTENDSTGTIYLNSSRDNIIQFGSGSGISNNANGTSGDRNGVNIKLQATNGTNSITYTGTPSGDAETDDHDGINAGANNTGNIALIGGTNTINVGGSGSDGIYTADGSSSDVTLTAETGNNTITAGNNGIDHRGSGTVTLQADNGGNLITAGKGQTTPEGDGVRIEGNGNVILTGQYNTISAADDGLYIKETSGENASISVTASGANENTGIGNYIEGNRGIVAEAGAIDVTAAETTNQIQADVTGVLAKGEGTKVTVTGKNNIITVTGDGEVDSETNGDGISGIHVTDGGQYIVEKNGGNSTQITVTGNKTQKYTYGIHAEKGGGAEEGNYHVDIDSTDFSLTAEKKAEYSSGLDVNGIASNQSSVKVHADNKVDIQASAINQLTKKIANAHGIYAETKDEGYKDSEVQVTASDIQIQAAADGSSASNAFGLEAKSVVSDQAKAIISLEAESGISISAQSTGTAYGIDASDYADIDVTAHKEDVTISAVGGAGTTSSGIYADSIDIENSKNQEAMSTVSVSGRNTFISGTYSGIYANRGKTVVDVTATEGSNRITGGSIGAFSYYGANISLTAKNGNNEILRDTNAAGSFTAGIYANLPSRADAQKFAFTQLMAQNNIISDFQYGVYASIRTHTVLDASIDNRITADNYGIFAGSTSNVTLDADNSNFISAGDTKKVSGFGDQYAIYAIDGYGYNGSSVTLNAQNMNAIQGTVYASGSTDADSVTKVEVNGQSNIVQSAAVVDGAGDLNNGKSVISSLYAAGKADISLSGEKNIISTYANSTNPDQLERVIWAYNGADITVDGTTTISTDRYKESPNSADIAIAAGTAVNLTKEDVDDAVANPDSIDHAVVTVNYDSYADNAGNTVASSITGDIVSAYAGQVYIQKQDGAAENAKINIEGNLLAGNGGILNVDLGNGGVLEGRADDYGDAGVVTTDSSYGEDGSFRHPAFSSNIYKGGAVNLTMGEGARWNVTGQSWVTSINTEEAETIENVLNAEDPIKAMKDMATIDLVSANTDQNQYAHAMTIYEMKGDAVFNMSLDGNRDVSDMLYMKKADGNYIINVVESVTLDDMYAIRENGERFDGLRFATVGEGSDVSFRAVTIGDGVLNVEYEVGTDSYDNNEENEEYNSTAEDGTASGNSEKPGDAMVDGFFESDGTPVGSSDDTTSSANYMVLSETDTEEETQDTGAINYKLIGRADEQFSNAGQTIIDMSKVNYSNAVYMDRLNKRMGEARYIEGDDGLWVRLRHDRIGKEDAFRSMNTMFELGYDRKVQDQKDGEHRRGVAFDYMRGEANYTNVMGSGDVRRAGVWLYDTWLGDKGHYSDYVLKYGRLSNDFDIFSELGDKISGDYDNDVWSASAEYGRKKDIGNKWYFEPQAQLQYAYVTSADYTTSQGSKVELDGIDSLIGRAGFRLGRDTSEGNTVYFKADILHEFLGDQSIRAIDGTGVLSTTYDNEGTWYDVGFGFSHRMGEDSYMFLDVEHSFGNDNEDTYQINIGLNRAF